MTSIKTIKEAEVVLAKYIPMVRAMLGKDVTLERMVPLMEYLGNPQDNLKIIHIAGTSGKTSTSYYASSLLCGTRKKVGLSVSPHIDTITERIQINGKPIDEEEFCRNLEEFENLIVKSCIEPSYFEYLIAFAYWYFNKSKVEYAVIETGLGGLYDSTNVVTNQNKVCIITDIGMDHMHILGSSIKEIATQKAGIIHKGNYVFKYNQSDEVDTIFSEQCNKVGAKLFSLNSQAEINRLSSEIAWFYSLPDFQKRNLALAYNAVNYVLERDGLNFSKTDLGIAESIVVPGRMDIAELKDKRIIMDGAHNYQKMQAFVSSYIKKFGHKKVVILFSIKQGKEYQEVIDTIKPIAKKIIITNFSILENGLSMSEDISKIGEYYKQKGIPTEIIEDQELAYNKFVNNIESVGIITGSFYLIASLRSGHDELRGPKVRHNSN